MRSAPWPVRSRTRGARTATGPMPVMISRSGRWPWRATRRRPSSVRASEWPSRNAATSASTARANRDWAPLRSTSVNGSENVDGWESFKTVLSLTAYHSFVGEVEARSPPRYAALTLHPSPTSGHSSDLVTSELLRFAHYVEDHDDHAHPGRPNGYKGTAPKEWQIPCCSFGAGIVAIDGLAQTQIGCQSVPI